MSYTITKQGGSIKVDDGLVRPLYFEINSFDVNVSGDKVSLRDRFETVSILYSDVTTPSAGSAELLADAIIDLKGDAGTSTIPTSGTISDGRKTVTVAGTAETVVGSATPCKEVLISALDSNTGRISVGGSTTVAADGTERGDILFANDSVSINIDDLEKVYIDSTVSGEGVTFKILS